MNDEIKDILDRLKDDTYVPLEDGRDYKLLYKDDDKLLLDYITNLQHTEDLYNQLLKDYDELEQAYQELKDTKQWWNNRFNAVQRDYEDYKSRIEKAVEYIEKSKEINYKTIDTLSEEVKLLKGILNGENVMLNNILNILNGRSDE